MLSAAERVLLKKDTKGDAMVATIWQDVRYALRTLRRTPGFTATATITLAIGIGGTTAVFGVLHAVILRPLPYTEPDRLVAIGHPDEAGRPSNVGYLTFRDWRAQTRAFEDAALVRSWLATITDGAEPERVNAVRVSWNFFHVLGIQPALGRDFRPEEDQPEAWRVVLLSDALWRRRFGADAAVVGRSIQIHGRPFLVVGVMPPSLEPLISGHYYQPAEMWAPIGYDEADSSACRSCQHLNAIARLRRGISIESARAELVANQAALARQYPRDYGSAAATLRPLRDQLLGDVRPTLLLLFGAVAAVLLIACANLASLLLARGASRERELALRAALGASRGRVARQLLTESLLLAFAGGSAGVALALFGADLLTGAAPDDVPRLQRATIDATALAFSFAVSAIAGIAFGLVPALGAWPRDPHIALRSGHREAGDASRWGRRALVAAEVAIAIVLLAGAGLMIRTMCNLFDVDPGFDSAGVLALDLAFVGPPYAEDPALRGIQERVLDGVRALPGVDSVAFASQIPLSGNMDTWGFHVEGHPLAGSPDAPQVERYGVTPEYFRVMRIPLKRGRLLAAEDGPETPRVIVVGETTAHKLWPGQDPIGRRVRLMDGAGAPYTVIGIVGDVRHYELSAPPTMQMYLAEQQFTDSFVTLTVRATGDQTSLIEPIRKVVFRMAAGVAPAASRTLDTLVAKSAEQRRFVMLLLAVFAAIALTLAMVGVYGTVAYTVARRTREFGVRMALGARRADIARLVFLEGGGLLAAGVVIGAAVAIAVMRLLDRLLYGVAPGDPVTFVAIVSLVAAATVTAQLVPVFRATTVDPSRTLQAE
jgi:putative ABC transport system permease protein